jgi:hypothetical protein
MKLLKSYRIFFVSVVVAFILWFYVKSSDRFQHIIPVPLQLTNVREGFVVVSDLPEKVPVLFESDGRTLIGLRYFLDVRYVLDASVIKEGQEIVLSEHAGAVRLPSNTQAVVVSVPSKDTIALRYERLLRRRIPIRPLVRVACEAGYVMVGDFRLHPDSLDVELPESYADSVPFVPTAEEHIEGLNKDQTLSLSLGLKPSRRIRFREVEVEVFVDIQPLGETVMENLSIQLVHVPPNVSVAVQPSTFSLRLRGGIDFLASLSRDSVRGVIDYDLEQRLNRAQPVLQILVPRDVTWTQLSPNRFNLIHLDDTDLQP